MRKLVAGVGAGVCLVSLIASAGEGAFDLDPGTKVLAPIQFRQLALFPVVQSGAATIDKTQYLTLSEGLERKLVAVRERRGGAQVNQVTVDNHSDRPLLLLGGEVILGGQQDRILGKDTIVPARDQANLQVFCVEHGRWNGGGQFTSARGMADAKMRVRAKFRNDQSQVWDAVARKNDALKASPSTGTYRNLAAGAEGDKALKPYRDQVTAQLDKLPEKAQLVGVIAAVNGRVTSVDVFSKPELFASYREKLLDSIFITVADAPVTAAPPRAPEPAAIRSFIQSAESAPAKEVMRNKGKRTSEKRGNGVLSSTVDDVDAPTAKPVYKSYQADQ